MQGQFELRDDSEVAAAAPKGPEQLRVLRLGDLHDRAVRSDQLNGEQVVAGQAVFADQMADAAA